MQCPQEGRGDEHGDWEQIVLGLAVAGDDAQIFGGESRTVCRVERGAPPSTFYGVSVKVLLNNACADVGAWPMQVTTLFQVRNLYMGHLLDPGPSAH